MFFAPRERRKSGWNAAITDLENPQFNQGRCAGFFFAPGDDRRGMTGHIGEVIPTGLGR